MVILLLLQSYHKKICAYILDKYEVRFFHFFVLLGLNLGELGDALGLGGEGDLRERWSKKLVFSFLDPGCAGDLSLAVAFGRETKEGFCDLDLSLFAHLLLFSSCSPTSSTSASDEGREGRESGSRTSSSSASASEGGREGRESEERSGKKLFLILDLVVLEGEIGERGEDGENPAPMKSFLLLGACFLILGAPLCLTLSGEGFLFLEGLIGGDLILTTPRGRERTGDFAVFRIHTRVIHLFIHFGFLQG